LPNFAQNRAILHSYFENFPGVIPPDPHGGRGRPPPTLTPSTFVVPPQTWTQIYAHVSRSCQQAGRYEKGCTASDWCQRSEEPQRPTV